MASLEWSPLPLIQQNWSLKTPRISTIKINQGTKFGTEKPMFSFFDVIIFLLNGKIQQII